MITTSLVPVQPPMPQVSVPLDELMKLAGEFLEGGRLSEAERLLDHIISAVPDAPSALHLKGIVLFRTDRHAAAAELIERAIDLAPDAMVFRRNLCPIYERLGRYHDALRVCRQAPGRRPPGLQTVYKLG